jgi:uncharacterized protein (DUF433 family)
MQRSERNGGFYVAGTRVSLDSIVYSFKAGDSPGTIRQNFSSLTRRAVFNQLTLIIVNALWPLIQVARKHP